MTPEQRLLAARVESFNIYGTESPDLPFVSRLARENGWSRSHAERVIKEYKRFLILATTGVEPVCPSEDVDAAWHLHLTYTRSYWKRLCGEVLGRPLHHEPTAGGPAEARKHFEMYIRTLDAYRQTFGEVPPAEIWPKPKQRFGDDLRHRVVNTAHNWVIPKDAIRRTLQITAAGLIAAILGPGCAGGEFNPFNLTGADFLYFLIPVMIAATCFGRMIRSHLHKPDPQPGDDGLQLNWEQTAFLVGGYPRLTTAAIARLVQSGAAKVSDEGKWIEIAGPMPENMTPVERAVWGSMPIFNTAAQLKPVQEAVEARFSVDAMRLERDGFAIPKTRQAGIVFAALLPILLVVLLICVPRLLMGMANGKPVQDLVFTMALGGALGAVLSAAGNWRLTRRGQNSITLIRSRNAELKSGSNSNGEVGLAVALFGTMVLADYGLVELKTWFPRQTSDGSSGGCGSGCGAGCGSGGDGGGGGCSGCGGGGGD